MVLKNKGGVEKNKSSNRRVFLLVLVLIVLLGIGFILTYNVFKFTGNSVFLFTGDVINLDDGLVSYWNLNSNMEDSVSGLKGDCGPCLDFIQQGGTEKGIVCPFCPALSDGKINQAYLFDGNDYISVADDSRLRLNNFSICAWIKPVNLTGYHMIVEKGDLDKDNFGFFLIGNDLGFEYYGTSYHSYRASSADLSLDNWYFGCVTFEYPGKIVQYLDGNAIKTDNTPEAVNTTVALSNNLRIGAQKKGALNYYFNGSIDEVRIYSRALNSGEVLELYLSGNSDNNEKDSVCGDKLIEGLEECDGNNESCVVEGLEGIAECLSNCSLGVCVVGNESSEGIGEEIPDFNETENNSEVEFIEINGTPENPEDYYNETQENETSENEKTVIESVVDAVGFVVDNVVEFVVGLFGEGEVGGLYVCGNGITEPGEACDGTDLNGYTCATVAAGFKSGDLSCNSDCKSYDVDSCVQGDVIRADSCEQEDVQNAIDLAEDGDIVLVPEGECNWTGISGPAVKINKSIVLKGAGIDLTNISDSPGGLTWDATTIWIESEFGKPYRITGFTFKNLGVDKTGLMINGLSRNWRIDHNNFIGGGSNTLWSRNENYGLIDNCEFLDVAHEFVYVGPLASPNGGDNSWSEDIENIFGTSDYVYIENNTITYVQDYSSQPYDFLDSNFGGRYALRYNDFIGMTQTTLIDSHGWCTSNSSRGTRSVEIYGNTLDGDGWSPIASRGGAGFIFNNTIIGYNGVQQHVYLWNQRSSLNHCGTKTDPPDPIDCTADTNNPSTWEMVDRPCKDQTHNLFIWNNTANGGDIIVNTIDEGLTSEHVLLDRDYFLRSPSLASDGFDYVPYVYPHPLSLIDVEVAEPPTALPFCGNNITEPGEACDLDDVNGYTCATVAAGFKSGYLSCNADCKSYNVDSCVQGDVIRADSCSQEAVQSAIDSASDGDIVLVPEGECVWDETVTVIKSLLIKGAGSESTFINALNTILFDVDVNSGSFRLTGFSINGIAQPSTITIDGNLTFRIDHSTFSDNPDGRNIYVGYGTWTTTKPAVRGVIDHVTYPNASSPLLMVFGKDDSWEQPDNYGFEDAVFVEDSSFSFDVAGAGSGPIDGEHGARYVLRNNNIMNGQIQQHDTGSTQQGRGTRLIEVYNNTMECTLASCGWGAIGLRGGTGVIFNNIIENNNYDHTTVTQIYRVTALGHKPWIHQCDNIIDRICSDFRSHCSEAPHSPCSGDWSCSGEGTCTIDSCTQDSDCSTGENCLEKFDGQLDSFGWPCRDQTGRGIDDPVTHVQESSPLYWWNNENLIGENLSIWVADANLDYIKEGRDYYETEKPGYVPYVYPHPLSLIDIEINEAPTTPVCGNNITEAGEACDGTDVNDYTCGTVAAGFKSGSLSCNADCKSYNVDECVQGDVIRADSCEQSDVQDAINNASDGDIVVVPEGNCTWNSSSSCSGYTSCSAIDIADKSIVLKGAGQGITIIRPNNISTRWDYSTIYINNPIGKPFRITGITFNGTARGPIVRIVGEVKNFRIDHCDFINPDLSEPIITNGYVYGLIDNINFIGHETTILVTDYGSGTNAWKRNLSLGTANAVYVENTIHNASYGGVITNGNAIDSNIGARYVFRNNVLDGKYVEAHSVQYSRGTFSYEVYNNTIIDVPNGPFYSMHMRAGTGVIYNNIIESYQGYMPISVDNARSVYSYDGYYLYGQELDSCNGTNILDGNLDSSGYPCLDQIGRSTDYNISDNTLSGVHPQSLEPLYGWNNLLNGEEINITLQTGACPVEDPTCMDEQIIEGRDYYNDVEKPGYVPYVYPHPLSLIDVEIEEDIIPVDRMINWSNAGIPGGIPDTSGWTIIDVTQEPYNAVGDGVTDDWQAIQNAIYGAEPYSIIYLPEGNYFVSKQLEGSETLSNGYLKHHILLKGDGSDKTKILSNASSSTGAIYFRTTGGIASTNITSGYSKGSNEIIVENPSLFNVGDFAIISQDNDLEVVEGTIPDGEGRLQGQIVKIIDVIGNTISLSKQLYYTYSQDYNVTLTKYNFVDSVGIENLSLEMYGNDAISVRFYRATNCWVNGVEIDVLGPHRNPSIGISLETSFQCEATHNYVHHTTSPDTPHIIHLYGIAVSNLATDNLVEDNIINYASSGLVIHDGATGNVFAYNYVHRTFGQEYPYGNCLKPGTSFHGGHSNMNLFEGNNIPRIFDDNFWGSSRSNTHFRDYSRRYSQAEFGEITDCMIAVEVDAEHLYYNFVGNVFGRPSDYGDDDPSNYIWLLGEDHNRVDPGSGRIDSRVEETILRHGNFNYVTNETEWDSSISNHDIPDSLYLTSKPSWFGDLTWPAIGPDLANMTGKIPAQVRFEEMQQENKVERLSSSNVSLANYTTIQECADVVSAGQTCLVYPGTYDERVTIAKSHSGTENNRITFNVKEGEEAVMYGFYIDYANYITINGFNITGNGSCYVGDIRAGIFTRGNFSVITNNYISGIKTTGISGMWLSSVKPMNAYVANNTISLTRYGIVLGGENWIVENNEIYRVLNYPECGDGDVNYMDVYGENQTIRNNYFHGARYDEMGPRAHHDCFQTDDQNGKVMKNILITNNICLDYGQGIMFQNHYNLSTMNSNITIVNNVFARNFVTDKSGAILIQDTPYVTFVNNTIYETSIPHQGTRGGASIISANTSATTQDSKYNVIKNNIFAGYNDIGYTFDYNGYTDYTSIGDYNLMFGVGGNSRTPRPGEHDLLEIDPLFVNASNILGDDGIPFTSDDGLRLQQGSSAIGAGRYGGDIGAYEFNYTNEEPCIFNGTYYIDYESGDDTNTGGCKEQPWKKHPFMNGFNGTYTHTEGDRFIFKGGVSWLNEAFPLFIANKTYGVNNGGNATNIDYYGVDFNWYKGNSWTRPIFDLENQEVAGDNNVIVLSDAGYGESYITFDNFEIINQYWGPNSCVIEKDTTFYAPSGSANHITIRNMYIHNWSHNPILPIDDGTRDCFTVIRGSGTPPYNNGSVLEYSEIEGSGANSDSGAAVYNWPTVRYSKLHNITNGIVGNGNNIEIYDNEIYNIGYSSFTQHLSDAQGKNHVNGIEIFGPAEIYNNLIYNIHSGDLPLAIGFWGCSIIKNGSYIDCPAEMKKTYIYNNIIWDVGSKAPYIIDTRPSSKNASVYLYNNIGESTSWKSCIMLYPSFEPIPNSSYIGTLVVKNHLCISDTAQDLLCEFDNNPACGAFDNFTLSNNLIINHLTASSYGLTKDNLFATLSSDVPTVDVGVDLSDYFTTDIEGNLRPQGNGWDIGAYESSYAENHFTTDEDTLLNITLTSSIIGNWTINGTSNGRVVNNTPIKGVNSINISYTPNKDYYGSDSFSYNVSDGVESKIIEVSITINPVNDAPVIRTSDVAVDNGDTWVIRIVANDVEDDPLVYSIVGDLPANADFNPVTQLFTFTPSSTQISDDPYSITINVVDDPSGHDYTPISVDDTFDIYVNDRTIPGEVYYVTKDGIQDGLCTGNMLRNLSWFNDSSSWTTLKRTADDRKISPGDTVNFCGKIEYRMTIRRYGGLNRPITLNGDVNPEMALVYGFDDPWQNYADYVTINGFNITNNGDSCTDRGIFIRGDHMIITNNYISGIKGKAGISGGWISSHRPQNIYVANNTIYNSAYGIVTWGDNWIVEDNIISRPHYYVECASSDADYMRTHGNNITIRNNLLYGGTWEDTLIAVSEISCLNDNDCPNPYPSCYVDQGYCVNKAHLDCFQIFDNSNSVTRDLYILNNICLDYGQGIFAENRYVGENTNFVIANNVFARNINKDKSSTISVYDTPYVTVENNTIYEVNDLYSDGGRKFGINVVNRDTSDLSKYNIIKNNIIVGYNTNSYVLEDSTSVGDYNLVFTLDPRGNDPSGIHDIEIDPLFVNASNILGDDGIPFTSDDGLRLQQGSSAIGAGENGQDIGAYESGYTEEPTPEPIDYFDWNIRLDRHGKPSGIFEETPFPITEITTEYTIMNDEYPEGKTYYLGTKYYVDGARPDDSGDGLSLGTAKKTIAAGIAAAGSGNKAVIIRGAHDGFDGYYPEVYIIPKSGIDDTHRWTIVGYGQERPVIDGASTVQSTIRTPYGGSTNFFTLQRMKIQDNYNNGIRTQSGDSYVNVIDVWLYNNSLYHFGDQMKYGDGNLYFLGSDNNWIFHATSEHSYGHCFKVGDDARDNILEWSIASECGYWEGFPLINDYGSHPAGFDFPNDFGDSDGDGQFDRGWNNIIRYSIAHTTFFQGAQLRRCPNFSFHHNEIYDSNKFDNFIERVDDTNREQIKIHLDDTYGKFYSNIIRDSGSTNTPGLRLIIYNDDWPEINIYNNIFYNNSADAIYSGTENKDTIINIFSNTFYGSNSEPLLRTDLNGEEEHNINIKNNILYQAGTGNAIEPCGQRDSTCFILPEHSNNLYYAPNGQVSRNSQYVLDPTEITADPLMTIPSGEYSAGEGSVSSSSPVIDNGTTLSLFNTSFNGVARPQGLAWDIGAYEYTNETSSVCQLTSAYWSSSNATNGSSVTLTANGNNCANKLINYTVYEPRWWWFDSKVMQTASRGSTTWVADAVGTYYFTAVESENSSNSVESDRLRVHISVGPVCGDGICNASEIGNCRIDCGSSLYYNLTKIRQRLPRLNLTVERNFPAENENYTGEKVLNFSLDGKSLVLIRHNFSLSDLDLRLLEIEINKTARNQSYVFVRNATVQSKMVYLNKSLENSNAVCIADYDNIDVENFTCTKIDCPGSSGDWACDLENGSFVISGLAHSLVMEDRFYCGDGSCYGDESCSSCSADCGVCGDDGDVGGGGGGGGGNNPVVVIVTPNGTEIVNKSDLESPLDDGNSNVPNVLDNLQENFANPSIPFLIGCVVALLLLLVMLVLLRRINKIRVEDLMRAIEREIRVNNMDKARRIYLELRVVYNPRKDKDGKVKERIMKLYDKLR